MNWLLKAGPITELEPRQLARAGLPRFSPAFPDRVRSASAGCTNCGTNPEDVQIHGCSVCGAELPADNRRAFARSV
jgi:ribosomal protein L37E